MRWLWTDGPVTSGVVIAKSEPQPPAKPKTETPPAKPKTDTPPAKLKTESPSPTPAPPATEQGAIVEPEIYVRPRRGIFGRLRLFREAGKVAGEVLRTWVCQGYPAGSEYLTCGLGSRRRGST